MERNLARAGVGLTTTTVEIKANYVLYPNNIDVIRDCNGNFGQ